MIKWQATGYQNSYPAMHFRRLGNLFSSSRMTASAAVPVSIANAQVSIHIRSLTPEIGSEIEVLVLRITASKVTYQYLTLIWRGWCKGFSWAQKSLNYMQESLVVLLEDLFKLQKTVNRPQCVRVCKTWHCCFEAHFTGICSRMFDCFRLVKFS